MNLEFKIYQLKEETENYDRLIKQMELHNEFIIVGEENIKGYGECFGIIPTDDKGLRLLPVKLNEQAMCVLKNELELKKDVLPGIEIQEIDIPKEYLTMDVIENIQRLNS